MANFKNITSATTTTLNDIGVGNGNYKLKITNNQAANQTVTVQLLDTKSPPNVFYVVKNLVMPEATSVVLDDMMYDTTFYSAQIVTTGTTNITIRQIYI